MKKREQNYSIGLDIGTTSVGWSVVDENYQLLKYKGRTMWGSHLFDEAKTAKARRVARSTRRRIERRKERIALLKKLMGSIVLDVDPNFFMRMEKGYQTVEDKGYMYNLFNGEYNDKAFYQQYPTIYHLRKELCVSTKKMDPRFVYIVLHHIMKYRGNFLYEGQTFSLSNTEQVLENFKNALEHICVANDFDYNIIKDEIREVLQILMDHHQTRKSRESQANSTLSKNSGKESKPFIQQVVKLLLGYESNITKLFSKTVFQGDGKDYHTNFSSTKFEDEQDKMEAALQADFEAILLLHNVYSFLVLHSLMGGGETLYDAMIAKYDMHKHDLKELKALFHKYFGREEYQMVFKDKDKKGNYYAYINEPGSTSKAEFYGFITKKLEKNKDVKNSDIYKEILNKIEQDIYMPKQNSKDNGAIPYQLHEMELRKILDQQGKFYPILNEEKEHILATFHFRIPYYVGPLNPHTGRNRQDSPFVWMRRKEEGKIYPWNFSDKVDEIASAEAFIRRMTNTCTYLLKEEVVPKKSLLYSRYEVLNELNKVRVAGNPLDPTVKQDILKEVFLKKIKVKHKDIWEYCKRHQLINANVEMKVEGTQKEDEFASSLEPWIHFQEIYGDSFESSMNEIEKIIEWITVYEDKKILKERIEKEFPTIKDNKLKHILKKRYTGWGNLSRKLLCELRVKNQYGEFHSIMDCLEETKKNFMQIINDKKLGFYKLIEQEASIPLYGDISYEDIDLLQGSPALKKGIWQTVSIVKEIIKVMDHEPLSIFLEFARSDEEKKRTNSRVKNLQERYKAIKKMGILDKQTEEADFHLSKLERNEKLDDRLYLYYIQQGKCMYSGRPLDIDKLSTYQIDHIIPQSYIKDDSIDNKVLVLANKNQEKGDKAVADMNINFFAQKKMWEQLHKTGLISTKKFKNLTRKKLSEREEMGFINRQLVETRQITKHVANLFKNAYEDVSIVSIKAGLSHDFREKFNLYKIREINDYHHAQDAYLACVIGTFIMKKYPVLQKEFIFTDYNQITNFKKDLENTANHKYGFVINQMSSGTHYLEDTGEVIWDSQNTLKQILKAFYYKDCFVTKKLEERKGQLFNLTIKKNKKLVSTIKRGKGHKIIPVNKARSDIIKYGGFTNLEYGYGIAISYSKKKKIIREIINVPILLQNADSEALLNYLKAEVGSEEITIIKDKILFNQLMDFNGQLVTMASTSEWNNACQLVLSKCSQEILYQIFHNKNVRDDEYLYVYDEYLRKLNEYYPLMKKNTKKLEENRDRFLAASDKIKVLKELLKITKASAANATFTEDNFITLSGAGRITVKRIYLDTTTFISQSVTGLYSKKYKL